MTGYSYVYGPVPSRRLGRSEVISEEGVGEERFPTVTVVTNKDILALLSRRPCTAHGVSASLGLHIGETAKRLQALIERGVVSPLRKNGALFYEIKRISLPATPRTDMSTA